MSTRNTKTERDGYGFGVVALIGVVITVVLAGALMLALYGKASDAIEDVRDCAAQSAACPTGSPS